MEHLPIEALHQLILHIPFDDLMALTTTNNSINKVINNNHFWKEKLYHDYQFATNDNYKDIYFILYKPIYHFCDMVNIDINAISNKTWNDIWICKINKEFGTTFQFTKPTLTDWLYTYNFITDIVHNFASKIIHVTTHFDTHAAVTVENGGFANVFIDFELPKAPWEHNDDTIEAFNFNFKNANNIEYHVFDCLFDREFIHVIDMSLEKQKDTLYKILYYCTNYEVIDNRSKSIIMDYPD